MHSSIGAAFNHICSRFLASGGTAHQVLEVGATPDSSTLLALPAFQSSRRVGINMGMEGSYNGSVVLRGNGNNLDFSDESFDIVVSNATLEHDLCFWLTIAEMRRVTKKDGLLVIGVPGFGTAPIEGIPLATPTFQFHGAPDDYWRFSSSSFQKFFFEGWLEARVVSVMNPPRLIGWGRKPK